MMTTEAVKSALKPLSGKQIERLAVVSGVPAPTIYKIRSGETPDPRGSTLKSLSDAFDGDAADLLRADQPAERQAA